MDNITHANAFTCEDLSIPFFVQGTTHVFHLSSSKKEPDLPPHLVAMGAPSEDKEGLRLVKMGAVGRARSTSLLNGSIPGTSVAKAAVGMYNGSPGKHLLWDQTEMGRTYTIPWSSRTLNQSNLFPFNGAKVIRRLHLRLGWIPVWRLKWSYQGILISLIHMWFDRQYPLSLHLQSNCKYHASEFLLRCQHKPLVDVLRTSFWHKSSE